MTSAQDILDLRKSRKAAHNLLETHLLNCRGERLSMHGPGRLISARRTLRKPATRTPCLMDPPPPFPPGDRPQYRRHPVIERWPTPQHGWQQLSRCSVRIGPRA